MHYLKMTLSTLVIAGLTACGGGGGEGDSNQQPLAAAKLEGAWEGTTSNGDTLRLIALEDNSFWGIFGRMVGDSLLVEGFTKGSGQAVGNQFSGTQREFDALGNTYNGTFTASIAVSGASATGATSVAGGNAVTFSLASIPTTVFDYQRSADAGEIAGAWNGQFIDGNIGAVTITTGGQLSGSSAGCSFSGSVTPRASGKNVFNFSVTFGGGNCLLPGQTMTGVALVFKTTSGISQLIAGATDNSGTLGQLFLAQR